MSSENPTYRELLRMSDDQLLQHGFVRNARNGITRVTSLRNSILGKAEGIVLPLGSDQPAQVAADSVVPRRCCGGGTKVSRKTIGVMSLFRAKMGGMASLQTRQVRLELCLSCKETEQNSTIRLFRNINNKLFCGEPRSVLHPMSIVRDEQMIGCGCVLTDKVRWRKARCPRDLWGEVLGEETQTSSSSSTL